ncbi:hypothetical protein BS47DRAFT_1340316 [Hydnum rufescens UP504]|uniref:Uncharacterized protein n=1 Tax=Hydnum rufescens UP504 TaxID=1448309 RepID=A0A9P6B3E9_9AGAM|nr:hypothetical protein BS47DRAFT_1340316 [Hydnum rufescens UP504]
MNPWCMKVETDADTHAQRLSLPLRPDQHAVRPRQVLQLSVYRKDNHRPLRWRPLRDFVWNYADGLEDHTMSSNVGVQFDSNIVDIGARLIFIFRFKAYTRRCSLTL